MKKIKFILPVLFLSLFSCDDYLDINDSPNALLYQDLTPSQLLPGAQMATYRVQATTMNQLGNVYMNSWTRNVASFGNGYDRELRLILDSSFYNGIWDGLYRGIMNFQGIIDKPNASGDLDHYIAIAKICKVHYMQYIVDLYGDAPYTEAWKGRGILTPKYDDDYQIYKSLIAELESARTLLTNTHAIAVGQRDVMLGGDVGVWTRFANTL